MILTQHNINAAKIADKKSFQPELQCLFITPQKTAAADRYKLVEVTNYPAPVETAFPQAMRGFKPFLVSASDILSLKPSLHPTIKQPAIAVKHLDKNKVEWFNGLDGIQTMPVVEGKFPDYQKLFPTGKPRAEVTLTVKHLKELLAVVDKLCDIVKVKIYEGSHLPVVITGNGKSGEKQNLRALLMSVKE